MDTGFVQKKISNYIYFQGRTFGEEFEKKSKKNFLTYYSYFKGTLQQKNKLALKDSI